MLTLENDLKQTENAFLNYIDKHILTIQKNDNNMAVPGGEILLSAALFYAVLSPYWSVYWSTQKRKFGENFWNQK